MRCTFCGDLSWTILKYGQVIHKHMCPDRIGEFHQGNTPPPIPQKELKDLPKEIQSLLFTCHTHAELVEKREIVYKENEIIRLLDYILTGK